MSDWQAAMNELRGLVKQWVREEISPTGVAPGVYSSVTVNADGRIRYGGAGGGMTCIAYGIYLLAPTLLNSPSVTWTRMEFDGIYDPGSVVTQGTAFHITVPSDGLYRLHVHAYGDAPANTSPFVALRVQFPTDGGTVFPLANWQTTGGSAAPDWTLNIDFAATAPAGGTIWAEMRQSSGTAVALGDAWFALYRQ